MNKANCQTCHTNGRKGYCALGRCYCGHQSCWASDSWTDLPDLASDPVPAAASTRRSSWDTREESTWIDKL